MLKRNPPRRPPTPRFYLSGKGSLNVRFSYRGQRVFIALHRFIDAEDWNDKKQMPKTSLRGRHDLIRLAEEITQWEKTIIQLFRDVGESVTVDQFRQEILYRVGAEPRPGDRPKDLHGYLAAFIADYKARPGVTKTSWGKFEALQAHLRQFEADTRQQLEFETIDHQFKEDFTAWMYAPPRNFANNNASKIMAAFRQVMRDAYRKKVHTNAIQEDRQFIIQRKETNSKVRLTVPELYKIEHYDFSDRPHLERARDLLIFACWTGLRVSDWHNIGRANFHTRDGQTTIELITQKTKNKVIIPVVPQVEKIFDRYNYKLPKLAQPYVNRLLKEVCQEAIPEATFTRVYSDGGQTKTETAYKYQFVSTHCGRKSFASNMYEATGKAYPIMQITGHKSEAVFQKYVDLQKADTVRTIHLPAVKLANWQPK